MKLARGQVWRGINHGSLLKVLDFDDKEVAYQVLYVGNPQLDSIKVGSVRFCSMDNWLADMEYRFTLPSL